MSRKAREVVRCAGRRLAVGLGLAYAIPALAYAGLRPLLGRRKGWIELIDDFAPWLYLPAPFVGLVGLAVGSRVLPVASAALGTAFVARWGRRFLRTGRGSGRPDLTLLTFNVLAWERDATEMAVAIEDAAPDMVTLQENGPRATAGLILALEQRLPFAAVHAIPTSSGVATFSRYPILEYEPFRLSPSGAHWCQRLVIDAPGGPITLLNLHAKIPRLRHARRRLWRRRIPRSFHAERRLVEVRALCDLIDAVDGPLLVMGDFNMTERSGDYALIARRLTDAYRAVGVGLGHTFPASLTFPPGLPAPFPMLRLDHIWHSAHFRTVSARVGPSAGSDHHAVIVQVERRA